MVKNSPKVFASEEKATTTSSYQTTMMFQAQTSDVMISRSSGATPCSA